MSPTASTVTFDGGEPPRKPVAVGGGGAFGSGGPFRARATIRYRPGGRLPYLNSPRAFGGTLVMPSVPGKLLSRGPSGITKRIVAARFGVSPVTTPSTDATGTCVTVKLMPLFSSPAATRTRAASLYIGVPG